MRTLITVARGAVPTGVGNQGAAGAVYSHADGPADGAAHGGPQIRLPMLLADEDCVSIPRALYAHTVCFGERRSSALQTRQIDALVRDCLRRSMLLVQSFGFLAVAAMAVAPGAHR